MTRKTFIKRLSDGRYEYGFIAARADGSEVADPYGRATSRDMAEFRLSTLLPSGFRKPDA